MKVITGIAKGKNLITVEGTEIVRPTTQKVKEAIFSAIQFDLPYANVVDIFCGCGQMGIEALSREASHCIFVDSSKKSIEVAKKNLNNAELVDKAKIFTMDYKTFLSTTTERFDISFVDPPYSKGIINEVLPLLTKLMNDNGIIFCEHDSKDILPEEVNGFSIRKTYKYGRIAVTSYVKK